MKGTKTLTGTDVSVIISVKMTGSEALHPVTEPGGCAGLLS
jgi:hypothetical protein